MKCPVCTTESEGRFCPECGAAMKDVGCRSCSAPLVAGARYCTQCGQAAFASQPRLPWIVAGIAMTALAAVMIMFVARGERGGDFNVGAMPTAPATEAGPFGDGGADPAGGAPALSADPRVNADRLFNRIMQERANGNTQQAQFFLPMALDAYGMAEPLDDDGIYHMALLQSAGGQYDEAVRSAERILENNPAHLLALAAAGEAMVAAGDTARAREYYSRFLDAYDVEKEKVYPEYLDHGSILPEYQEQARALVGG